MVPNFGELHMHSIRLYNIACWHLEKAETANLTRDRQRHAEMADRLFIFSWMAR